MIPQDRRLMCSQRLGDSLAFTGFIHHTSEIIEEYVVLEKRAGILCNRFQQPPQRRPGLAIQRM